MLLEGGGASGVASGRKKSVLRGKATLPLVWLRSSPCWSDGISTSAFAHSRRFKRQPTASDPFHRRAHLAF